MLTVWALSWLTVFIIARSVFMDVDFRGDLQKLNWTQSLASSQQGPLVGTLRSSCEVQSRFEDEEEMMMREVRAFILVILVQPLLVSSWNTG